MTQISEKTIERLILYKRLLKNLDHNEKTYIYSHELSTMTGFSSAQIRRDLMAIGYSGSPTKGYHLKALINSLSDFIEAPHVQPVALIGLGHLGRAILDYFQDRKPKLKIIAAFDRDPTKINRIITNCRSYPIDELQKVIQQQRIKVAIIAIPAENAQEIAEKLIQAGITGILNYASTNLNLPAHVYVENRDMIMAMEKVAYFSRHIKKNV